jgi:RIO-like serine/threonine protein kinase
LETSLKCNGERIAVGDILGIGGTATVYKGTYEGKEVVVKMFRTSEELLEREKGVLGRLKEAPELLQSVPKIVGVSDSKTTLLLSPVGTHFAHSSRNHKASLPLATRFSFQRNV